MSSRRRKRELSSKDQSSRREEAILQGEHFVVRKGSGVIHNFLKGSLKLENLTCGANSRELKAAVVIAEPGASCEETEIYVGEKWYYILKGKLKLQVNDVSYLLSEGDSIYLEYAAPHTWRNPGKRTTKALVLSSPLQLSV